MRLIVSDTAGNTLGGVFLVMLSAVASRFFGICLGPCASLRVSARFVRFGRFDSAVSFFGLLFHCIHLFALFICLTGRHVKRIAQCGLPMQDQTAFCASDGSGAFSAGNRQFGKKGIQSGHAPLWMRIWILQVSHSGARRERTKLFLPENLWLSIDSNERSFLSAHLTFARRFTKYIISY